MSDSTRIPTPEAFFLETPLYTSFMIGSWNFKDVFRIEYFQGTLDTYCIKCEKESVFDSTTSLPAPGLGPMSLEDFLEHDQHAVEEAAIEDRNISLEFECTRDADHVLEFFFRVQDSTITKIGQCPSLADLRGEKIKKYRKTLGDAKYRELSRAVGLSAHGVGIGAFVYLRRIFEGLIDDARAEAAKETNWDEGEFQRGHMDEKILMLRDFLPSFLVQNRTIYSILSKGIHSLAEEECLRYFEPLRLGIELILDEKIEQEDRAKKISKARKALDSIRSELR